MSEKVGAIISYALKFLVLLVLVVASGCANITHGGVSSPSRTNVSLADFKPGDVVDVVRIPVAYYTIEITSISESGVGGDIRESIFEPYDTYIYFGLNEIDSIQKTGSPESLIVSAEKSTSAPPATVTESVFDSQGSGPTNTENFQVNDTSISYQVFLGMPSFSDATAHSRYTQTGLFGSTSTEASADGLQMEGTYLFGFRGAWWSLLSPYTGVMLEGSFINAESSAQDPSAKVSGFIFSSSFLVHADETERKLISPYVALGIGVNFLNRVRTNIAPVGSVSGMADAGLFPDLRAGIKFSPFKSGRSIFLEARYMALKFKYSDTETYDFFPDSESSRVAFDAYVLSLGFEL